jgi:hypothetical protein
MRQALVRKSTIVILVIFVFVGISIFIRENDLKPLERTVDVNLLANQQSGNDYLETFDNSELKNGVDEITYIGYKNIKDFYTLWEVYDATTPSITDARLKILSGIVVK